MSRRIKLAALLAVAAAALATAPGQTASGQGQIVISAADSGSHLRVTTNGSDVIVNGYMSPEQPTGCSFTHFRTTAVCPTADVGSIAITMGPANDKIEILDPLPLPVTAYLGNGSDKHIGNAEADTCYPQGARRNRCYGGAGNDICVTGRRNTDCVGDGGDDYAKFSTGSDGCWGDFFDKSLLGKNAQEPSADDDPRGGSPGNDVCLMGPGKDGAHGDPGNDLLDGGAGSDRLYGQSGDDVLLTGGGSNKLLGGSGDDILYAPRGNRRSSRLDGGPGHDICYGVFGRDGFHNCGAKINLRAKGAQRPTEQELRQRYLAAWPQGSRAFGAQ